MTTGATTIERLAATTGQGLYTVDRVARALKQAGRGQWPVAGPGGGKNSVHVQADHAANLLLGLAALSFENPTSRTPDLVETLRSLVLVQTP